VAIVLLGLGSNVGDRPANLRHAAERISKELELLIASPVYETAPMYVTEQDPFLNAALLVRSELPPLRLLKLLKGIEDEVGRVAGQRFGPREIDIDLISYGSLRYKFGDHLEVPHPRVVERRFVLQPLADIAPDATLPGLGVVTELLQRTNHQGDSVRKVSDAVLPLQSE
jgi:2-amino-4-hydroxy-6-hydroxymethyldihydropteridine diphosphokinase